MLLSLFSAEGMVGLVTLILLEIVLGIDNIIFIAILCGYIPDKKNQRKARTIGLMLAMVFRVLLLLGISWIVKMTAPLFYIGTFGASGRDLILFAGGVFLIYKTCREIYHKLKSHDDHSSGGRPKEKILSVTQAILQITIIDIIFSFDSILTAVGLSRDLTVMITAVVISMFVMLLFAPYVSNFINRFPTIKILAMAFLVCIGIILVFESLHLHIDKSYVYVAMIFSLLVELLNIRYRKIHH